MAMLFLLFEADRQTYALDAGSVLEVAPYPLCTPVPHAPQWVAGLAVWRGRTIPVVDLSALVVGVPAPPLLSTRLIVVEYAQPGAPSRPLGLVAEKAVETVRLDEGRIQPSQVSVPGAPYLHGTTSLDGRLIHRLTVQELLPGHVRALLFPAPEVV